MKKNLLLKRLFSVLFLLFISTISWAYDFEVDGIYYNKNSDGTSVTVTHKNASFNSYYGSVTIPATVTYDSKNYDVTSIGGSAFNSCSGLTSVKIPNSVTSIGDYAFSGCSYLTSITIPNSVTSIGNSAFYRCSNLPVTDNLRYADTYLVEAVDKTLSTYNIKARTRFIGSSAFSGCSGLTSINIPDGVTSIGDEAFCYCSGLTSVTIPSSVTSIGGSAFYDCSGLTKAEFASIESLCKISFNRATSNPLSCAKHLYIGGQEVKDVVIPNSVTSIGQYAFYGCSGLTSITIPNSVTSIGQFAFSGCSGLTSVTIPESVTSIGSSAFNNCSGLTSVKIPNSVTSIGSSAFSGCSGLTSVTIGNSVTSIGNYAFSSCSGLTSVTIPNSVTSIGQYTFSGCSGLTSVTLNSNAIVSTEYTSDKSIGYIFGAQVKEYNIGNEVTSIGANAFSGCSELTTISIGNGIKSIGTKAFANCGNIYDVYCYAMRYPTTSADAFENSYSDYITLHVPDESVDNYKAVAPWNTFKKVVGISSDSGREACEKPVLTYKDGKLEATSETEGAQCVIIISDEDVNTHSNSVNLTATYHISAYATKPNYKNSEIVTATLCWIDQEPETEGLINDVAEVRALPVLIQSEGGVISVNGVNSGTEVRVYSVNGIMAGSAAATDNSAQINTNLLPGSIAIVKIGEKSVKIVMK